ncbi:NAK protein kinase [Kwoniella heveanensis BCC8398]|uniref:non-specific serine/threonine protein kinase n=1 Tax=Kwoniella heveanensis BCC8398 TaxID=1296120 RepID=A0A1B9GZK7_9TREE|nr:NAK protein kinase [Kwoniella heveanensis BCC8398]
MYSSAYSPSTSSPYTSPPAPPHDPYRASPISVASKQPYNAAFSPPPQMPAASYPSMPIAAGQSRAYPPQHQQQQPYGSPQQYARGPSQSSQSSRYVAPTSGPYGNGHLQPPAHHHQQQQQQLPPPQKHKGTLAPGQIVRVGEVAVRIERYLSEGGYAHVYLTTSEKPVYPPSESREKKGRWGEKGYTEHCLKRIAFQDDAVWVDVKKEIEVMKSLPPNPHLIQYLGSTHSKLPSGGHEVFILMEFCAGGGIIDLLNKRLRDRLKEIEILNIFTDVCEAVAAMHHLPQPLLHRDLKIENVLSQPISTPPTPQRPSPLIFKLCDFGSTTFPADKPPSSKIEADALAMDLNKHTTLQYRSPEMVEPMLGLPVGLPSDVWALGCLLYKLCYYTTPFEEHGPLAIVNAKYTFPPVPVYSPRLQHLIASMLVEQPHRRPSVFEVLRTTHEMSGTKPEVDYPIPSRSLAAPSQSRQPSRTPQQPNNLLDFTGSDSPIDKTPVLQPSLASTVQPQRRGRPTREPSQKQIEVPSVTTNNAMPPMPVPPAQPQPTSSSFQARTQTPKLQITGDRAPPKAPSPGLDAFGMPSIPTSTSNKSARGFGDSFAAPKSSVPTGSSHFGANLPRPPTGFGDSFGVSRSASMSSRPSPKANLKRSPSTTQRASSNQADPTSAAQSRKPAAPSSSVPDGELSFETRFPSIETITGSDAFTPPIERENLISPVTSPPDSRPQFASKPSVMGNMTGGDMRSPTQPTAPMHQNQPPQPRSTHVTGTAFKGIQGGVQSPSPTAQKTDYFGHATTTTRSQPQASPAVSTASAMKSPLPEDLMGDEESNGLQVPSIQPGRSATPITPSAISATSRLLPSSPGAASTSPRGPPSSPGSLGAAKAAPASGHHRPLLPNIDASKPTSNIMSDQWSPLERLRSQGGTPAQASQPRPSDFANAEVDSSDDEVVPEDAGARGRRPSSPPQQAIKETSPSSPQKLSQRALAFGGIGFRGDTSTKSSTVSIPLDSSSTSRPGSQRDLSGSSERSRPQSMFITPSSSSSKSFTNLLSPPITEEPSSSLPKSDQTRPSHGRKGSITDIVSRYEMMKPPSAASGSDPRKQSQTGSNAGTATGAGSKPTAGSGGGVNTNGLGRKPSIASKPQALRKSTVDEQKPSFTATTASSSTVKPSSPTSPVKPKVAAKPGPGIIAPKPIRHGSTPAAEGYSRSSSGRSFPITITKPAPLNTSSSLLAEKDGEGKMPNSSSGKNSPEKQQPVNLLIQRWNQGQTANANANKIVPKRGGYI